MEKWRTESSPLKQIVLSIVCILIGLVLAYKCRDFGELVLSESLAGFLLGILLLIIGIASIIIAGKQSIVIDPGARRITIDESNVFKTKTRTILFDDIIHIGIGYLGKRSNYVTFYYLVLRLRNGEEYPLFAPGRFYKGGSSRETVEGWRTRLEDYISLQQLSG
jgi:hypothetical protein